MGITTIEKQEAEDLAAAQRANEQASRNAEDSTAILNTLSEFQTAFNGKNLAALQGIWTGMPKNTAESYRAEFRNARSLEFRLTPTGHVTINGNSATVICTRSQLFIAKNGERPPPSNDRVRVTLDRAGSRWVIRAISSLEK